MSINERITFQLPLLMNTKKKSKQIRLQLNKTSNQLKPKKSNLTPNNRNFNWTQTNELGNSTFFKEKLSKRNSMLASLYTLSSTTQTNTYNSFMKKKDATPIRRNSLFLSFLSNQNILNRIIKTRNDHSGHFNAITQSNLSRIESIDETIKESFAHLVRDVNQTSFQSQSLHKRYENFLINEENRINKEFIDLKPQVNQPLFNKSVSQKTDFSKVVEQLIKLKKNITPQLIKKILKNSEEKRAREKRKEMLTNQLTRNKTIMKLLSYRRNVANKVKDKKN